MKNHIRSGLSELMMLNVWVIRSGCVNDAQYVGHQVRVC